MLDSFRTRQLALAILLVGLVGCDALLGIDDRTEIVPAGGAGGGGAGVGGALGGAGAVGGNPSGGGGGQTGADGGTGGEPPAVECETDEDCSTSPDGPVCDADNRCVECAGDLDCEAGTYCSSAFECEPGCSTDDDCNLQGGAILVCDVATHQCTGCASDDQCPPGLLCNADDSVCVDGCTPDHTCQTAHLCCAGECANVAKDEAHCGTCGSACNPPNAEPKCEFAACTWESCSIGFGDCNGQAGDGCEVNLRADVNNCFACGNACSATVVNAIPGCIAGACEISSCEPGFGDCDGDADNGCEEDLSSSVSDCGTCGFACSGDNATPSCFQGACDISCLTGFGNCDGNPGNGCEVDLSSNVAHCGACNSGCTASAGNTPYCAGSMCGETTCAPGTGNCDGDPANGCEVDLDDDDANCGACGLACNLPNASMSSCSSGSCVVDACDMPYDNCDMVDANGCEQLLTNVTHCGMCDTPCAPPNATGDCDSSVCTVDTCAPNRGDCDGFVFNGCEVDLNTNDNHCSACNMPCDLPNATSACSGGGCIIVMCDGGFGDCNGDPSDGCETAVNTTANCGICDNLCDLSNATEQCVVGSCEVLTCDAGFDDCNMDSSDGCEIDTQQNVNHCGFCDNMCPTNMGTPNCVGGMCGVSSCNAPLADCDGQAANGCEVDTSNNVNHCSACGAACTVQNGNPVCSSSTCSIASCNGPYEDCDGQYASGCEVNTNIEVLHCGGCNSGCSNNNGTPSCSVGDCAISCFQNFDDCDMTVSNGCEASLLNQVANCGSCATSCVNPNGNTFCVQGQCEPNCIPAFDDCDGNPVNGCETNIEFDEDHCGGCNMRCALINALSTTCTSGKCDFLCLPEYDDCDFEGANGCEAYLPTDPMNCGSCGNVCDKGCTNGSCFSANDTGTFTGGTGGGGGTGASGGNGGTGASGGTGATGGVGGAFTSFGTGIDTGETSQ